MSEAQVLGKQLGDVFLEECRPAVDQAVEEVLAGGKTCFEAVTVRPDETRVVWRGSLSPVRAVGGEVDQFMGVFSDITDRTRAEEALRTREAEFKEAQRVAHVGNWTRSLDTGGITWSEELYRIFGLDPTLPIPEFPKLAQFYTPKSWEQLRTAVEQAVRTGASFELSGLQLVRPDGETRWVATHGEVMRDAQGQIVGTRGTVLDITNLKRAEEEKVALEAQVQQAQALARLGEMAAVVAHEVKNPLAGVRSALQIISSRLPPGGKDATVIGEIVGRLDALNELMNDVLIFARPPQAHPALVDLLALAKETSALVSHDPTVPDMLHFEFDGSASPVMVDPRLLQIVLLNLFLNAAHAMQHQGTIRVSTATDDHTCRIVVADTGPGIPPGIRDRIFTPFFTTKARGTGLGLPTTKRLVDAHQGTISVACPREGGTQVTIELPR